MSTHQKPDLTQLRWTKSSNKGYALEGGASSPLALRSP